jgi:hypothetical protein
MNSRNSSTNPLRRTARWGKTAVLGAALALVGPQSHAQVTVSGAVVGNGPYTTLGAAFTAINGGGQGGANIVVSLSASTTEATTATLNAGAWTTLSVTATVPVTVSGSIIGSIIRLNGADNVTIDGRIAGVGNNITVSNTSTSAATAAVWLSSVGVGAGCLNNVVRNLNLSCGVLQASSTNSSFGIIMSGTAISTTNPGQDNDNNQFLDNSITQCRYGIVTRGEGAANLNQNTLIEGNTVGAPTFGANRIGKVGIFVQFENLAIVRSNTVQNVGVVFADLAAGADRIGIGLGTESWSSTPTTLTNTNCTITRNIVNGVFEEKTFSSVGIACAPPRPLRATT